VDYDLEKATVISVLIDISSHEHIKINPMLVRYSDYNTGVEIKITYLIQK
jgi:hypothetical protein